MNHSLKHLQLLVFPRRARSNKRKCSSRDVIEQTSPRASDLRNVKGFNLFTEEGQNKKKGCSPSASNQNISVYKVIELGMRLTESTFLTNGTFKKTFHRSLKMCTVVITLQKHDVLHPKKNTTYKKNRCQRRVPGRSAGLREAEGRDVLDPPELEDLSPVLLERLRLSLNTKCWRCHEVCCGKTRPWTRQKHFALPRETSAAIWWISLRRRKI